ncbi:MAG: hypothetical protein NTZ42_04560 [Candidatus Gribaldobacteria bacterium]|nr:hypothetical protein [Candidatus Gribaldobacteria bacterium]
MNEDLENLKKIITNPLLSPKEQEDLLVLLDKNGETEEVYQKIQAVFEQAIRKQVAKAGLAMESFDEQVKSTEIEMEHQKELLLQETEKKLAGVEIDNLTEHSKVWDDYYEKVFALWRKLESDIRDIAATILSEQIKTTD